ncbi:MAG: hypothetical protein ACFE96_17440 [Candidatus Hermodarchaeota archaeon]
MKLKSKKKKQTKEPVKSSSFYMYELGFKLREKDPKGKFIKRLRKKGSE